MPPAFTRTAIRVAAAWLATIAAATALAQNPVPERPAGWADRRPVTSARWMVAAANPLAVDAGYSRSRRRRQRGRCRDRRPARARIGRAAVLRPRRRRVPAGPRRADEAARRLRRPRDGPGAASPIASSTGRQAARLLRRGGRWPVGRRPGRRCGCSETAHRRHGRLPWASLFAPAIALAERGFAVSPRLNRLLAGERHLTQPRARAYFYDDERQAAAGRDDRCAIRRMRRTLRAIAAGGATRSTPARSRATSSTRPTRIRRTRAISRSPISRVTASRCATPVCGTYRGYRVCGLPLPSSGGAHRAADARHARALRLAAMGPASFWSVHFISEAGRLAYADRGVYDGRPRFLHAAGGAARRGYLRSRSALIRTERQPRPRAAGDIRPRPSRRRRGRVRRGHCAGAAVDVARLDRRPLRQRGGDDDDDRGCVRQPAR